MWGPSASGGRNRGFPAGAVSDSTLLPDHGTGGDRGEFDSPTDGQQQKETIRQQRQDLGRHVESVMGGMALWRKSSTHKNS